MKAPDLPDYLTDPCARFAKEYLRLGHFIASILWIANHSDEFSRAVAKVFFETAGPSKYIEIEERLKKDGALQTVYRHMRLIFQMMFCRSVDNYLAYISELLALIFRVRPETPRSNETIRLDEILRYATMEQLIDELADRKVNDLSYQGMRELLKYLLDRLGFELYAEESARRQSIRIVEVRNLIVHNRGIVNRVFQSRLPDSKEALGQSLDLDVDTVFSDMYFLAASAFDIDAHAANKFGLDQKIGKQDIYDSVAEQVTAPDASSGSR